MLCKSKYLDFLISELNEKQDSFPEEDSLHLKLDDNDEPFQMSPLYQNQEGHPDFPFEDTFTFDD